MREAVAYIDARLTGLPDQRIEALDLAEDVSGLPIAMAQAVGVIADSGQHLPGLPALDTRSGCGTPPARSSTAARRRCSRPGRSRSSALTSCPLPGLAWPALAFAAMLDTGGIPAAVLASPAACGFITGHMSNGSSGDQNMVRSAFGNLERLGLVTVDKASAVRTVWVHPAVRAAVRAYLPPDGMDQAVAAAAAALLEAWPEPGVAAGLSGAGPQLSQALRDCAASLRAFTGDMLWKPEAHPLLIRAGASLDESLLADAGIGYWQTIAATCSHLLGPAHAQSVQARDRLAAAYSSAAGWPRRCPCSRPRSPTASAASVPSIPTRWPHG